MKNLEFSMRHTKLELDMIVVLIVENIEWK